MKQLDFYTRAEYREMVELCEKHHMTRSDIQRVKNAYLKAYVTGIIDNYEFLETFFKAHAEDEEKERSYTKDELVRLLYDMKAKAFDEYCDY